MSNKAPIIKFGTIIIITFLIAPNILGQNSAPTLKSLTISSQTIVIGIVNKTESFWDKNKSSIHTKVTIKTSEYLKGKEVDSEVYLKVPGGEVGNVGELYTHMPRFSNDEEVLLFIKKEQEDYTVMGGRFGKISLSKNEGNVKKNEFTKDQINNMKNTIKSYLVE